MVPLGELTIDHLEHEENICAVYPDTVGPSSQILVREFNTQWKVGSVVTQTLSTP